MADVKQYLESLAQSAGLDEVSKQALLQAIENEKFAKGLSDGVMRQEDYSRSQDALRKDKEAVEADKAKWLEWYQKAATDYEKMTKDVTSERAKRLAYEQTYGTLEDGTKPKPENQPTNGEYVSKKDMETMLNEMYSKVGESLADINSLSFEHFQRFGKPLDVRELAKTAAKTQGQPISAFRLAYQELTKEDSKKAADAEKEQWLATKQKEWEQDYASKHNMPIETRPSEAHPFFDRKVTDKPPTSDAEKMSVFKEAFHSEEAQAALKR